jgi:hypothetical protein
MSKKKRVDQVISFKLRMPEGLRQQLETVAREAGRSMNSEILWRLGQTFGEEWQRFIAGMEEIQRDRDELIERVASSPAMKELIAKHLAEKEGR